MPTTLPTTAPMTQQGRRAVFWGVALSALLAVPVVALLALESLLAARCTTTVVGEGVLVAKTFWRIERRDCSGGSVPFYDVMIGVESKAMASALTGRGDPRPVHVRFVEEGRAEVQLSAPLASLGTDRLGLRLRRSGSPAERIDLERLLQPAPARGAR